MRSDKKKINNYFNKNFFNFKKNIKDIWNGKHSLVYSFWIVYVVYISVLTAIAFYLGELLEDSSDFKNLLYLIFVVFIYIFSIIASVGILRSASKYIKAKKRNNLSSFWGKLAQLIVFLAIISSIIELFKLVKNF